MRTPSWRESRFRVLAASTAAVIIAASARQVDREDAETGWNKDGPLSEVTEGGVSGGNWEAPLFEAVGDAGSIEVEFQGDADTILQMAIELLDGILQST